MNPFPLYKHLLVLVIVALGALFALPNIYGEDPALQITEVSTGVGDDFTLEAVRSALERNELAHASAEVEGDAVVIRFTDTDQQFRANDVLRGVLDDEYSVAPNLVPAMPEWLRDLGLAPMSLGLDLRGGIHVLLEVDMETAIERRMEAFENSFRSGLREAGIRYVSVERTGTRLRVELRDPEQMARARSVLTDLNPELTFQEIGTGSLEGELTRDRIREVQDFAVQQNTTTLRSRVNELGVAEPVVQRQGRDRIVVQLPGVQDPNKVLDILKSVATLEFRMAAEEGDAYEAARTGRAPLGAKLYEHRDGRPVLLKREVIVTGDQLVNATAGIDSETGGPMVSVTLDSKGAAAMGDNTKRNLGKLMGVVFIEDKPNDEGGYDRTEEVISLATIQGLFSGRFQITGLEPQESQDLALLLRAGALAAPVRIEAQRTVGPSLGQENIDRGFRSTVIGFAGVVIFMLIYYRAFGLVANLALVANLVLIIALLSALQATLTLPGIAGIVLTVGMAVDANVLIFERIREELRLGNSPLRSIDAGYDKAFSTIADANITTLIAAIVLFSFGTGPVKGFAITLSLGIVTSMFTAIVGTRSVVSLIYGGRRVSRLSI